jgi:hypothetical protein
VPGSLPTPEASELPLLPALWLQHLRGYLAGRERPEGYPEAPRSYQAQGQAAEAAGRVPTIAQRLLGAGLGWLLLAVGAALGLGLLTYAPESSDAGSPAAAPITPPAGGRGSSPLTPTTPNPSTELHCHHRPTAAVTSTENLLTSAKETRRSASDSSPGSDGGVVDRSTAAEVSANSRMATDSVRKIEVFSTAAPTPSPKQLHSSPLPYTVRGSSHGPVHPSDPADLPLPTPEELNSESRISDATLQLAEKLAGKPTPAWGAGG